LSEREREKKHMVYSHNNNNNNKKKSNDIYTKKKTYNNTLMAREEWIIIGYSYLKACTPKSTILLRLVGCYLSVEFLMVHHSWNIGEYEQELFDGTYRVATIGDLGYHSKIGHAQSWLLTWSESLLGFEGHS
jgi:hypothetical protein